MPEVRPLTFTVTMKQREAIDKWLKSLHRSKKAYHGRDHEYVFSHASGIGVSLFVRDFRSNKIKEFTDYGSW